MAQLTFGSLARLVAFAPPVAALIAAENRASRWWPLRFPRSPLDFDRDSTRLFTLLTTPARGLLAPIGSSNTRLVEQTRSGQLTNEPDKNRTTGVFNLVIEDDGHRRSLRVITKFQSGRGMPLYMQAIRAVAEHGIAREIEFYRRLASVVPVEVPRPLFADSITVLNRVCLVLEYVDGDNQPDWRGCSLAAIQVLLANAARLNASLFDRLTDHAAAWIPARTGLEFADYVTTFIGKHEPWYRRIWSALQMYFEGSPVTLVHGDCRPGNMLFRGVNIDIGGEDEDAESEWPATPPPAGAAVVMCDWEAVNVAPLLWDFTYCTIIGLRVADRRAWQTRLLQQFLGHLRDRGVDEKLLDSARAVVETQLLAIVLAYVSLVVYDNGLWAGQGNTSEDLATWTRRVMDAASGGDAAAIAGALHVPVEDIRRLQEYLLAKLAPLKSSKPERL